MSGRPGLGPTQRKVLEVLHRSHLRHGPPMTAHEVTQSLRGARELAVTAGYVSQCVRTLAHRGLVVQSGKTYARCWVITPAGRAALARENQS